MLDLFAYLAVRTTAFLLNLLPLSWRHALIYTLIKAYAACSSKFKRVSFINLRLAFPDAPQDELNRILDESLHSLTRLIVDSVRLHTLDADWLRAHVETPFDSEYEALRRETGGKGVLFAGGHLGSFELHAFCAPVQGRRFAFIVRNFKNKRLDRWWIGQRERFGNKTIPRDGALRRMIRHINAGDDVGLLIDQNITRRHALFVEWFGKPAATTFALAQTALVTGAPVVIAAMHYLGNDRYRLVESRCEVEHIYRDEHASTEEKILAITQLVSKKFEEMIRLYPGEWFWMHPRWKTRPEGEEENFYR